MASSLKNKVRHLVGLPPDDTYMKQIDIYKDGAKYLDENQKYFVKKVARKNILRYAETKKTKKRGRIFGLLLLGFGVSLYIGTIYNIKQEKFLDELEGPTKS